MSDPFILTSTGPYPSWRRPNDGIVLCLHGLGAAFGAVTHRNVAALRNAAHGDAVHSLRIKGVVKELYDVAVLPGVRRPMALGFKTEEIRRILNIGPETPYPAGSKWNLGNI